MSILSNTHDWDIDKPYECGFLAPFKAYSFAATIYPNLYSETSVILCLQTKLLRFWFWGSNECYFWGLDALKNLSKPTKIDKIILFSTGDGGGRL